MREEGRGEGTSRVEKMDEHQEVRENKRWMWRKVREIEEGGDGEWEGRRGRERRER